MHTGAKTYFNVKLLIMVVQVQGGLFRDRWTASDGLDYINAI